MDQMKKIKLPLFLYDIMAYVVNPKEPLKTPKQIILIS